MTSDVVDRLRARIGRLPTEQREELMRALDLVPSGERGELVAYVATSASSPGPDELRDFLLTRLPDYMVPRRYVFLEALPRTAAGKLDRRALVDLAEAAPPSAPRSVTAPRTDAERALAEIWKAVLDTDEVDVHDDFFELGGDSILSIRLISRANQAGLAITPQQFFESPTIANLAALAEFAERPPEPS